MNSIIKNYILNEQHKELELYINSKNPNLYETENNRNYLEYSILIKSKKCANLLIKKMNINLLICKDCSSPWYNAAYTSQIDILKKLIHKKDNESANLHNYKTGRTPLYALLFKNLDKKENYRKPEIIDFIINSPLIDSLFLPCEIMTDYKKDTINSNILLNYLTFYNNDFLKNPKNIELILNNEMAYQIDMISVLSKALIHNYRIPYESFEIAIDKDKLHFYNKDNIHFIDLIKNNITHDWQFSLLAQLEQKILSTSINSSNYSNKKRL
jgi:hypothetical protein